MIFENPSRVCHLFPALLIENPKKDNVVSIRSILTSTAETLTPRSPRAPDSRDEESQNVLRVTDVFTHLIF